MTATLKRKKGTVPFGPYETWYQVTGDLSSGRPALVAVHGGPGSTHDYLRNLNELAAHTGPVVLYDQLGNGGSTHLPDKGADFWTPELFADELSNLLRQLGIEDNYVLFGQSWGGLLVTKFAAERRPACAAWSSPTRRPPTRSGSRRRPGCAPSCRRR